MTFREYTSSLSGVPMQKYVLCGLDSYPLCPRDKPGFSPYFTQCKPSLFQGQAQLVPGTIPGTKGGIESACVESLCVFFHWKIQGRFCKRVVLANVPSFRFSFWVNMRTYSRSRFCSGGTSECTLVPVYVPGEHPPKPPFLGVQSSAFFC